FAACEAAVKGLLFDCRMCGRCVLSSTGMTCPTNCPKSVRNGPCGGVRANGHCEVEPDMPCVWVQAWQGSRTMKDGDTILDVQKPVDHSLRGTSSWLRVTSEKAAERTAAKAEQ
ncbi:MAG: methylenetetrahydrofolate reductase, partial [Rhodospirillales bacterium]|nr:methylenetetrahydrofolate reductase [Rhodospirillales bacterium]